MANSLKDLVSSVDWSKMLSGPDARNALIGSALGGLMLGGAGLMAKRDPEESKYAPVGDALMGALLGGVAGYGIPKGLSLFMDAGRLAPSDDKLGYNYLGWGLGGATAGAGLLGGGLYKTFGNTIESMKNRMAADKDRYRRRAEMQYDSSVINGRPPEVQKYFKDRLAMYDVDPTAAAKIMAERRRELARLLAARKWDEARTALAQLSAISKIRSRVDRGYGSLKEVLHAIGEAGDKSTAAGVKGLDRILHPREWLKNWTDARHYNKGPWLGGVRMSMSPLARIGLRAGKYGAVGGALGLLAARLFGPSSHNNYKE